DVITLHIDGRQSNKNFIGEKEFSHMKDGVLFINNARGSVVDVEALAKAIKKGKVGGAAIDVFAKELHGADEKFESSLQGLSNVINTPHIGASTQEAQYKIGQLVSEKLMNYIDSGNSIFGLNFPEL